MVISSAAFSKAPARERSPTEHDVRDIVQLANVRGRSLC